MTLILGVSQPEGIYLAVDYRVTNSRTGRVIDDAATKHLTIHYPPFESGPKALVAYTGIAVLPDGTKTGDWIRETLRGEPEVVDDSMRHLRDRLDRDYGRLRYPLFLNFLVIHGERRYFGGMANARAAGGEIDGRFRYGMYELADPFAFWNGAGAASASAVGHLNRIRHQLGKTPNRLGDYMKLLSLVNRGIAAAEPTVSPYCHVAFVNDTTYKFGPESRAFTEQGESVPFEFPMLLCGIDLSGMMKGFRDQSQDFFAGRSAQGLDVDALNREMKRRP